MGCSVFFGNGGRKLQLIFRLDTLGFGYADDPSLSLHDGHLDDEEGQCLGLSGKVGSLCDGAAFISACSAEDDALPALHCQ